jgi:polysaccharide pyruvyl transferase CsaB
MHDVEAQSRAPAAAWQALDGARLLISGGGSLVQDVTSARSPLYYLGIMTAASWRSVPVAVVGQGVGPIRRPWIRRLAARAFDGAKILSVRDSDSARTLADLGVTREIHVGADLSFLATAADEGRVRNLLGSVGLDRPVGRIGVAVRPWPQLRDPEELGQAIRRVAQTYGAAVAVLPFDRLHDHAISRALASAAGGEVIEAEGPQDLMGLVGAMDVIVGVRLHALIFAASQAVPAVGLAYDPKISAFLSEVNFPSLLPVDATGVAVAEILARVWDAKAVLRRRMLAALPGLRAKATTAVDLVAEFLRQS